MVLTARGAAGTAARVAAFAAGFAIPTSTALVSIGAGLLLLLAVLPPFRSHWRDALRSPFVIACLAFWLVFALGALHTSTSDRADDMLFKLHPYLLVPAWFAVFAWVPAARAALAGFAIGAVLSLVLSLGTWLAQTPVGFGVPGNWAVFRNHIYHNLFVGGIGLAALAALLGGSSTPRTRFALVAVVAAAAFDVFFLVQGRTGQVVFLVMLGVLLLLWNRRRGLLLALAGLAIALPTLWHESAIFHERFTRALDEAREFAAEREGETSVGMRLSWARDSLAIIAEAPWLGHGTGSFAHEFRRHAGAPLDPSVPAPRLQAAKNPHNSFLWIGVEAGALGLAALMGVFATALFDARRLSRPDRWWVWLVVGGMAVGSLANSLVMDRPTGTGYLVLLCALLAAAPGRGTLEATTA